jgi:ATP-dependent RNA helicase SUPV3L1/SUV3
VRFGAFSLYLPSLLEPKAQVLAFAYAELASPAWRPEPGALNPLPRPPPLPQALALRGLRAVGQLAAPIAELERLDALARAAWPDGAGAIDVTDTMLADLGWRRDDAHHILRALGFVRVRDGEGAERAVFRRRGAAPDEPAPKANFVATPFAALAALTKPAERRTRRRKRGRGQTAGRAAS